MKIDKREQKDIRREKMNPDTARKMRLYDVFILPSSYAGWSLSKVIDKDPGYVEGYVNQGLITLSSQAIKDLEDRLRNPIKLSHRSLPLKFP